MNLYVRRVFMEVRVQVRAHGTKIRIRPECQLVKFLGFNVEKRKSRNQVNQCLGATSLPYRFSVLLLEHVFLGLQVISLNVLRTEVLEELQDRLCHAQTAK